MDLTDAFRTLVAARGFAELGMYRDAWDAIESLPALMRLSPEAVAVRVLVCAGLQKWETGAEFARLITLGFPVEVREAAGRCHLAIAEARCAEGDIAGAKEAVRALTLIWPEGGRLALDSPVLAPCVEHA